MEVVGVCRCCLAQGLNKDLHTSYTWLDRKEIYSDMLKECFNIILRPSEKESTGICSSCINCLRSSVNFKQQVLCAEQNFIKRIRDSFDNDEKAVQIKLEPKADLESSDDDYFLADAARESSVEKVNSEREASVKKKSDSKRSRPKPTVKKTVKTKDGAWRSDKIKTLVSTLVTSMSEKADEIKLEPKPDLESSDDDYFLADAARESSVEKINSLREAPVKKKSDSKRSRPKPAVKKTVKTKDGAWRSDKIKTLVSRLVTSINICDMPDIKPVAKKEIKPKPKLKLTVPKDPFTDSKINLMWTRHPNRDKVKHRENLQTILKFSNVCPFKNKSLLGYMCGYCESSFPDPADLRHHTDTDHKKDRLSFKSNFDMTEYNVKVDVAELICTLCDEKMVNLGVLKDHLVKIHGKTIYTDIKDHILQFKLKKGDVYDCAMCSSTYETFKMLKQHMNKHYCNYTCTKCNSSFATKRSLNAHRTTHQEGSFKCDHCEKIFSSRSKKQYHEKMKHLGARNISNCPYCNEPFRSYYQRNQHLVKVHNSEAQYKCNVCNKAYILKSLLMYHIKKNHLMERNCQCTECGYRFFSKKALKAHMVKHTGERIYACEVCHKSYARKYTLREHMRIHNNDRRFKCDVCSLTFVQKCSLKSHLLSNHGISMAACEITSS